MTKTDKRQHRHVSMPVVLIAIMATLLAACGGAEDTAAQDTAAQDTAAQDTAEDDAATEAAASPETGSTEASGSGSEGGDAEAAEAEDGTLVFYSIFTPEQTRALTDGFQEEYPFVTDVEVFSGGSQDTYGRFTAEAAAGQDTADVFMFTSAGYTLINEDGFALPYQSPNIPEDTATEFIDPYGNGTPVSYLINTVMYNTDLVEESEAPTEWEELADPKWEGELAMQPYDVGGAPYFLNWLRHEWGDDKYVEWLEGVAANEPSFGDMLAGPEQVVRGERSIYFPGIVSVVEVEKQKGAPVDWTVLPEMSSSLYSVNIYEEARRPETARLFVDWLLGSDAQAIMGEAGLVPLDRGAWDGDLSRLSETTLVARPDADLDENREARNEFNSEILD